MADVFFTAQTASIAFTTATKTLAQLVAAAQQRVKVHEWSVSFNGTSNTATPIEVDIVRQTSAGTMSALTLVKANNSDAETLQTTAQTTATAEPTDSGVIIQTQLVHPQTGYTWQAPFRKERRI